MFDFRQQNLINAQKQEAFILEETRKDNKVVSKKWKNERKFQIISFIVIVLIILSFLM